MKNERELQAKCLKVARAQNLIARKVETPAFNGFPDCIFIIDNRFMLIEFKHPNGTGKLSPIQMKDHARLRDVGVNVPVVDDFSTFCSLLARFIDNEL